ncbi:ROK family protein [Raoultella ornithinolytica]|nr:ROK family protein [Raoultella ornithinolytica]
MYYGFDIGGSKIALGVFDSARRLQWENALPRRRRVMPTFCRR